MEKELKFSHKLLTDYSSKGKLKRVIVGWCIYVAIFAVSRLEPVRAALLGFADSVRVEWVTSAVGFFTKGMWIVVVPMAIGTLFTLLNKQTFDQLNIYNTGLGFVDSKSGLEKYHDYSEIELSYGKMQESFYITCKPAEIKNKEYAWNEFSQPDVLENNLTRYTKFS